MYFSNIVINFKGLEATMVCQDERLCAGLKALIGGAVHKVQSILDENFTAEDWNIFS